MKRIFGAMLVGTGLLCGCGEKTPPPDMHAQRQMPATGAPVPAGSPAEQAAPISPAASTPARRDRDSLDEVIAKVNGEPLTLRQLVDPLIESRGLTMLVNLVELELAKQNAAKYHVTVSPKDFQDERDRTLEKMFKDSDDAKLLDAIDKAVAKKDVAEETRLRKELKAEHEDFLTQFLVNQHIDHVEFDIVLQINTYLRKILELDWKDKITEQDVRAAFGQMYGERVRVQYIDLINMQEVTEAQRRLANGDSFGQVARDMSHDRLTAPMEGKLPPFSREAPEAKIPAVFRDTAFSLRDGQVSDPLAVGSSFMLIKRIEVLPPQAVKYETVRDSVYRTLHDKLIDAGMKGLKQQLAIEARNEMEIINPVLARQFRENVDRQAKAEEKARNELDRQDHLRDKLRLPGTTRPADAQPGNGTAPPVGAAPQAPRAAAGERPPATQPGSAHVFALPRLGPDTQPSTPRGANK